MILKRDNLNEDVKQTVNLALMLLNEQKISIPELALIMYNLYETSISNEKSLKESLFDASKPVEESLKESIIPITTSDLLIAMKEEYENDNVIQRIIMTKAVNQLKIFHDLIKERIRLELDDCEIHNQMLYIDSRLYIPNHSKLKTKIIKHIHESPPGGHAKRSSTYNKMSCHYY